MKEGRRMIGCVGVLLICFSLADAQPDGPRSNVHHGFNFIGCLFSSSICQSDEGCIDDGLFGSCLKLGSTNENLYYYQLNEDQIEQLEDVLQELATSGYTWRHLYTQCILTSALISYRYGLRLESDFCETKEPKYGQNGKERNEQLKDSTDKLIDDLIDMLNAKNSLMNQKDANAMSEYDKELRNLDLKETEVKKSSSLVSDKNSDDEIFETLLNKMSASDIKLLKQFLIQHGRDAIDYDVDSQRHYTQKQHNGQSKLNIDRTMSKKFDPQESAGTITNVVIHYEPGDEDSSDDNGQSSETKLEVSSESNKTPLSVNDDLLSVTPVDVLLNNPNRHLIASGLKPNELLTSSLLHSDIKPERLSDIGQPASSSSSLHSNDTDSTNEILLTSSSETNPSPPFLLPLIILCALCVGIVTAAFILVRTRHNYYRKEEMLFPSKDYRNKDEKVITGDYQDLCRHDMRIRIGERKASSTSESENESQMENKKSLVEINARQKPPLDMDISTGHCILSYMEDYLKNEDKLENEWRSLCSYDAEPGHIIAAIDPTNMRKNRSSDILPYEHSRVHLNPNINYSSSDYINASTIIDDDPRSVVYVAAQGPLRNTLYDFWQMIWELGSTCIVNLTRLTENNVEVCCQYWPEDVDLYHIYEVKRFQEQVYCSDYVVRNFCLKNTATNETRTVTQFHYLSWPSIGCPVSLESLMDFRRIVQMAFKRSPIIVHCSDGVGQTGTYCLIDMVINRISKGAKEIDIAATLEHMRDQRCNIVRTKEQFEFALKAVAYEVQRTLK